VALTDLANVLLDGKAPPFASGTIFGINLFTIGAIKLIAAGYVGQRLAATVAWNYAKDAIATMLALRKLGFRVPVVHRQLSEQQDATWRTWKPTMYLVKLT
jgi:hypothetical protein